MSKIRSIALSIVICAVIGATTAPALAIVPLNLAERAGHAPIRDSDGRIYYIVDLADRLQEQFADVVDSSERARFAERHSAKAINMVLAFEKAYGFAHVEMTSWVGNSFAAYLNSEQLAALREDPRVIGVSEVVPVEFSAPPWYDTTHSSSQYPYSETSSWGRNAVNGKTSSNTRRVYIIDAGVGYHDDLTNVIVRVNASCGTNNSGCAGKAVVGCYSHATHVAGIIGAPYGNKGVAGVNAGAKLISVSAMYVNQNPAVCSDPAVLTPSVQSAMDWVKWDQIVNVGWTVGIVNISINGADFAPGGTLNAKILNLATPYIGGYNYAGSFVVQSAGNQYINACQRAFGYTGGTASASDGIMVAGAIDYLGRPVTPSNGGFTNHGLAVDEPGSNYGSCVEVWAPGKDIISTFGPTVQYSSTDQLTWQRQDTTYNNYAQLSGTSLAAPHVAGVAAYLAEAQGLNTPSAIESAVRALFYGTGQVDAAGLPVKLIKLP